MGMDRTLYLDLSMVETGALMRTHLILDGSEVSLTFFLFPPLSFSLSQFLNPLIFFSEIGEARVSMGVGFFILFSVARERRRSP